LKVKITFLKDRRCKIRAVEREKRKKRLQQFKKEEKRLKKGYLRLLKD